MEIVLVHFRRMRAKSFELNHDFTYEYRCLQRTVINRYRPIYVVLPVAPFWRAKITVIAKLIQPLDMRGFSVFITAYKVYRSLVHRLIWFHLTYWDSRSQNWIRKVLKGTHRSSCFLVGAKDKSLCSSLLCDLRRSFLISYKNPMFNTPLFL